LLMLFYLIPSLINNLLAFHIIQQGRYEGI
jgi:hypothetical protein